MSVVKFQINVRMDENSNMSLSFEHILNTEEEAKALAEEDAKIASAYFEGFTGIPADFSDE